MTWHSNTPESMMEAFLMVRLQVSSPPPSSSLLAVYLSINISVAITNPLNIDIQVYS